MSLTPLSAASCEQMEEICSQYEKPLGQVMCSDLLPDPEDQRNITLSLRLHGRRLY